VIQPDAYWRDYTGRFDRHPYFREDTLEAGAVRVLEDTLGTGGAWPVSDDDLEFVADQHASFDRGRDVGDLGLDVDAVTVFSTTSRPRIVLNASLKSPNMRLRRRMTIAHELGHVVLHQPLYRRDEQQLDLLHEYRFTPSYCHDPMSTSSVDWCEWQANYFGGALLAPKAQLLQLLQRKLGEDITAQERSREAQQAVNLVASSFDISKQAARVRLAQIGFIAPAHDHELWNSQSA
jgi:Zn-dependent peptidase ImmA (M78 family)